MNICEQFCEVLVDVQGTSITWMNTFVSQDLPLTDLMVNQRDQILTGIQIQEFETKSL